MTVRIICGHDDRAFPAYRFPRRRKRGRDEAKIRMIFKPREHAVKALVKAAHRIEIAVRDKRFERPILTAVLNPNNMHAAF